MLYIIFELNNLTGSRIVNDIDDYQNTYGSELYFNLTSC